MKNLDAEVNGLSNEEAMEVDVVEDKKPKSDFKVKDCDEMTEEDSAMEGEGDNEKATNGEEVGKSENDEEEAINELNGDVAPSSDFELELSETDTESVKNSVENSREDKDNDRDVTQELDNHDPEKRDDDDREESVETVGEQDRAIDCDDREETVETVAEQDKAIDDNEANGGDGDGEHQTENVEDKINGENDKGIVEATSEASESKSNEAEKDSIMEGEVSANSSEDKDSCKVLVSMFVSPNEKKVEEAPKEIETNENEKEEVESEKKDVERELKNTISLEMASDSTSEEEEVDINAGLDACFSDLEKQVEREEKLEESSTDQSTDSSKDDVSKEEKSKVDIKETVAETVDDSDSNAPDKEDDIVALDDEDEEKADSDNHDKALEELENIEKTTKKILNDDEVQSAKRPSSEDDSLEPVSKKSRLDHDDREEDIDHQKLKKVLKRMTRRDLEDMIQSKMVEILTNRSEIGDLRQKVDSYQKTVEKWQARAQALSKQCTDLGTVMKKYITDKKNKPGGSRVVPVKVTRSVGLQVMTADQKQRQQLKQQLPGTAGARIATKPGSVMAANRSVAASPVRVAPTSPVKIMVNNNATNNANWPNGVRQRMTVTKTSPSSAAKPKLSPQQLAAVVRTAGQVTLAPKTAAAPPAKKTVIDVVDLSDEDEPLMPKQPLVQKKPIARQLPAGAVVVRNGVGVGLTVHPAPLPASPAIKHNPGWKISPSKPSLKINKRGTGIVLSWNLAYTVGTHANILSYQLYAYQETPGQRPDSSLWKKVGDVKALPLPMACTLTQFNNGNKYHFAVRALDCHNRLGPFSDPQNIKLT